MFPLGYTLKQSTETGTTASSLGATPYTSMVTQKMWTENDTKLVSSSFRTSQRVVNSTLTIPDGKHCYAE